MEIEKKKPKKPKIIPFQKQAASVPDGFDLRTEDGLCITYRWPSMGCFSVLFFVVWGITVVPGFFNQAKRGGWDILWFLFAFVLWIFMFYSFLASFFNRTIIRIQNKVLSIQHKPIPWLGNLTLRIDTIQVFTIRQHYSESRDKKGKITSRSLDYEIHAYLRNGSTIGLLKHLNAVEEAEFLKRELNRYLLLKRCRTKKRRRPKK